MDVLKAVQEFFIGIRPPGQVAAVLITLIPKVTSPTTFSEYRPICLTNLLAKVITRLIATRFSSLLPKVISPKQAGFMKGRDITEQILLAQEMVHILDRPTRGGHVLIKLDMAKAFDRVCWTYLEKIVTKFGFHPRMLRLIINNLAVTRCSILINGKPAGFFEISRGVKQGDPLSPLLFILASEEFSRGLNALMAEGKIHGFQAGRVPRVSHLRFAVDLVIFLNGSLRNMQQFRKFLDTY